MQGGEVDLLGGNELVVGVSADIVNVLDYERVAQRMLCEKDYLRASRSKIADDCFAYTTRAPLDNAQLSPCIHAMAPTM